MKSLNYKLRRNSACSYFLVMVSLHLLRPTAHAGEKNLDGIVKKTFTISKFVTSNGSVINNLQIGYESYGTLNKEGTNAILVAHHFTGTSHAAGRYKNETLASPPGEWDALIGPNKTVDTNKYFIISADTLCNMNTKNSRVITTGPRSINPTTKKPYGLSFPVVTVKDFVQVQHALSASLGIKKFQAVIGASMGSMQALEWATDYPEMVARVVAVIPAGLSASPHLIATMNLWRAAIENDMQPPNRRDARGLNRPSGLAVAFGLLLMQSQNLAWTEEGYRKDNLATWFDAQKSPYAGQENKFLIENFVDKISRAMASTVDPESFLYTAKAVQLYQIGQSHDLKQAINKIQAKILLVPARSDLLLFPKYAEDAYTQLKAAGKNVSLTYIEGDGGHVDGIKKIMQVATTIKDFITPQ